MSCSLLRGDCLVPPPIAVDLVGAFNVKLFLSVGLYALFGPLSTGLSTGDAYFIPAIPDLR